MARTKTPKPKAAAAPGSKPPARNRIQTEKGKAHTKKEQKKKHLDDSSEDSADDDTQSPSANVLDVK
jgi:hypothetical protein